MLKKLDACPEQEPFLTEIYEISAADKCEIWRADLVKSKARWPEPGTPESELYIAMRTEIKEVGRESARQDSEEQT